MSWVNIKSIITAMLVVICMSFFVSSTAVADRYEERYHTENEWLYAVLLFSRNTTATSLRDIKYDDVIAIDTFGQFSEGVWHILSNEEGVLSDDWPYAAAIPADMVPMRYHDSALHLFDAAFLVRRNTFEDIYLLLEAGWRLGNLQHEVFEEILTVDEENFLFEPRIFTPSRDGVSYGTENIIYRIPSYDAYLFEE